MGAHGGVSGHEARATMSSRSVLIRWQYVTSQIMRDLVSVLFFSLLGGILMKYADDSK
jgi:hypothetical protein